MTCATHAIQLSHASCSSLRTLRLEHAPLQRAGDLLHAHLLVLHSLRGRALPQATPHCLSPLAAGKHRRRAPQTAAAAAPSGSPACAQSTCSRRPPVAARPGSTGQPSAWLPHAESRKHLAQASLSAARWQPEFWEVRTPQQSSRCRCPPAPSCCWRARPPRTRMT